MKKCVFVNDYEIGKFKKGKEFYYINTDDKYEIYVIETKHKVLDMTKLEFDFYFIDIQKERKEKLNKINKLNKKYETI